jgi:hypothetical protein
MQEVILDSDTPFTSNIHTISLSTSEKLNENCTEVTIMIICPCKIPAQVPVHCLEYGCYL